MHQAKLLARSALLCLFLGCIVSLSYGATFTNPYRLPTDSDPALIVTGDLNGDGVPDFVWTSGTPYTTTGSFGVYLLQPGGGWARGASFAFPANSSITSCALVDVNRDAKLDLVCSGSFEFTAYVHVFLGNGDGTFQPPITTVPSLPNTGGYGYLVLANEGDLNGDGLPDFFFEDRQSYGGYILLSDGSGGFRSPIQVGSSINNVIPFAADVNGDGIPDLLYPQGPEVALGKGDGSFGPIVNYQQDSYYLSTCIFHDMDGDGHLDAICGFAESTTGDMIGATDLMILHGNQDGSFNTTPISQTRFGDYDNFLDGLGTFKYPLAVADVNGDGILDVIGYSGDGLAVLLGGPKLTFTWPLHYAVGLMQSYIYGAYSFNQGTITDLNGDGLPDVVATGPNGIYISYGNPDGSFRAAFAPEVTEVIGYPTVADFNGDGIPDVAATGDSAVKISLGKGDGTFAPPVALGNQNGAVNFSTLSSATNAHIVHGDFNGDGKVDLLAIGSPEIYQYSEYIFWGNGDGTFQEPIAVDTPSIVYPMFTPLYDYAVYDINKDGRSDILSATVNSTVAPATSQILFSLSNGDGTFRTVTSNVPSDLYENTFFMMSFPALADFNKDGKLDAAYGSITNVYVINGHGDGTFDASGTVLPIPSIDGVTTWGSQANLAADFDGDGNADIAVLVSYKSPQYPYYLDAGTAVWVYYGDGKGKFSAPVLALRDSRIYDTLSTADLDGTGRQDIIVNTSGSLGGGCAIGVLSSLPGRTFAPQSNYFAGTGLSNLEIADLNRDGRLDLVFGNGDFNTRASSITVLLNQGSTPEVSGSLKAIPEPSTYGQSFNLVATLIPPAPGTLTGNVGFSVDGNTIGSATLVNGAATFTVTVPLAVGLHNIGATWAGDTNYAPVLLTGTHVVRVAPTTTTLVSSNNPANAGSPVVFTATTTSAFAVPDGSITFADGGSPMATVALASGVAAYTTSSLLPGSHAITASYIPTSNFSASSASLNQVIVGLSSAASLTAAPNPAYVGQSVTLSCTLAAGSGTPTGTIAFYDGSILLGTAALDPTGKTSFKTAFTAAGNHSLIAKYSGDSTYSPQVSPVYVENVLINPTTVSITATPNPAVAFASIAIFANVTSSTGSDPSGTVTFYSNGSQLGSAVLQNGIASINTSLSAGSYSITANYPGSSAFSSSNSSPYELVVTQAPSQTSISSSLNPAPLGSAVTFTSTTTAGSIPTSGFVQFFDGVTSLGSPSAVNSQGIASFQSSKLALGDHLITAVFSGNSNLLPSTSAVLKESIVPYIGDFAISIKPDAASIYTGQSVSLEVSVISQNGFNEPLTLGCSGLPAQSTCTFTPASFSDGQGTARLVIQTAPPKKAVSAQASVSSGGTHPSPMIFRVSLAALLAFFFVPRQFRRKLFCLILLAVCTAVASGGCAGPSSVSGGTPPGDYNVAVSATFAGATPVLQHTATLNLKVKSLF